MPHVLTQIVVVPYAVFRAMENVEFCTSAAYSGSHVALSQHLLILVRSRDSDCDTDCHGAIENREWKMRHQNAGVEIARKTSMESRNSRYLTLYI